MYLFHQVRDRLTTKLGVTAPKPGQILPRVSAGHQASSSKNADSSYTTPLAPLYLFGNDKALPGFADDDDDDE